MLGLSFVSCGGIGTTNGNGETSLSAEAAAEAALDAAGAAYIASIQAASAQAFVIVPINKSLIFEGETSGVSGRVLWDGDIGATENLDLNYDITFINYQATSGGVTLEGLMGVAVSENGTSCSGTWNISDLVFDDGLNDYEITTDGSGIILQGSNCEEMSLSGEVNISGAASGNGCIVSGTTANSNVSCN